MDGWLLPASSARAELSFFRFAQTRGPCVDSALVSTIEAIRHGFEQYVENSVARSSHAQVISDRQHESRKSCLAYGDAAPTWVAPFTSSSRPVLTL
jgi:hypothetical protein